MVSAERLPRLVSWTATRGRPGGLSYLRLRPFALGWLVTAASVVALFACA